MPRKWRNLIVVLADQLDAAHPALEAADPAKDGVVMIETIGEAGHVTSHKHRITLCLSAMRHFAEALQTAGWKVDYLELDDGYLTLGAGLTHAAQQRRPEAIWWVQPGEWRVQAHLHATASDLGIPVRQFEDSHFYVTNDEFAAWAKGRKQLTMEYFYRQQRARFDILMDDGAPIGGQWNFDQDNRKAFPKAGPGALPAIPSFPPDRITKAVIATVEHHFPDHPGGLDHFDWPVTREQALQALDAFIEERLTNYGRYQDAMWQGEPFLYHALIASSLNLKLLNPREAVDAAVQAWQRDPDRFPLAAVEGFVRQIVGWREFIRGVYWLKMPGYAELNHFDHQTPLPAWFWTGDTEMNCLRQTISDTLDNGYAHHIQRLMIIGNFATLAEIRPVEVCDWFLAVYVDAIEWVELPNTLGMALHGDGGIVGSKPYVASGAYINRMSNYCGGCRFKPSRRTGDDACPFNALYWNFLMKHRESLGRSPRMRMVMKNLDRWDAEELAAIETRAATVRDALKH
ncbi:MAG: cryptochrome/photolyase family protein [Pseudomonadota bacterium]